MKKIYVLILSVFLSAAAFAQVAINNDGSQPDSSAMLDIKSDNLGLLPPRMIRAQMNQIHNPAPGLIVFCTDCKGLYINLNGAWREINLSPSIGDNYGGGVVFYIDSTGQNGLISATSDQSEGAPWGCYGTMIGTSIAIGSGQANTTSIFDKCPDVGIAARICNDLILNGYDDWFLPSFYELQDMYGKEDLIGGFSNSTDYWSSYEFFLSGEVIASIVGFNDGGWYLDFKSVEHSVRCIRAFSTLPDRVIPTVTTTGVTPGSITHTSAQCGGNVISGGGAALIARGLCWGTSSNPDTNDSHTTDGNGIGSFTSNLTGLQANTNYHYRAYATNTVGTGYGADSTFTTSAFTVRQSFGGGIVFYIDSTGQNGLIAATSDQSPAAPWGCVNTSLGATETSIGTGLANTNAIVNGCPESEIAAKVCTSYNGGGFTDWFLPSEDELNSMYQNLKIFNLGDFANNWYWSSTESQIHFAWAQNFSDASTYLQAKNFTYPVRAIRAFTTSTTLPTVTTDPVKDILPNSATCGGNVTSIGGSLESVRGVCWKAEGTPTIEDNHTVDGSGTGTFVSHITGLIENTEYHVRAYATTSVGTAYGDDEPFTPQPFNIGQEYGVFGKIFWIDSTGQNGLVCVSSDCGTFEWGCSGTLIGSTSTGIGSGLANTRAIEHACPSSAAGFCEAEYVNGGYPPTFLPSKDELDLMYQQRSMIGGFESDGNYWSSSEMDNSFAWELPFGSGVMNYEKKDTNFYVRRIFSFTTSTIPPTVTTAPVTDITQTTATCGGNVISIGGTLESVRGVCWSIDENPDLLDSYTVDGSGTGVFVSHITGLSENTLYHVRAYVTNNVGTTYGDEVTFILLFTESFETAAEGQAPPDGWVVGTDPVDATDYTWFRSNGTLPSCTPADGSMMVEFDSYDALPGRTNFLMKYVPVSTVGYSNVSVDFKWLTDNSFPGPSYGPDHVEVQWSADGSPWTTAATVYRYAPNDPTWTTQNVALPGAEGHANLFIAFLFYSDYGNYCHLDLVHITAY
jgi:hypothetical protein